MTNKRKAWEGVEQMGLAKTERRRRLAKLPFERKLSILLHLQRMARGVSMAAGRRGHELWRCGE